MKIIATVIFSGFFAVAAQASITFEGTALLNSDIDAGQVGVFISSDSGNFDESLFNSIDAGLSFTQYTDWNNYTVLGSNIVQASAAKGALQTGDFTIDLGGNVQTGNELGVLVFTASKTQTEAGDTFQIYTDDWLIPTDGSNTYYTGSFQPFTGDAASTGVVVPEPSASAFLVGALGLGFVLFRRK